jgi:hypothetical protein
MSYTVMETKQFRFAIGHDTTVFRTGDGLALPTALIGADRDRRAINEAQGHPPRQSTPD